MRGRQAQRVHRPSHSCAEQQTLNPLSVDHGALEAPLAEPAQELSAGTVTPTTNTFYI